MKTLTATAAAALALSACTSGDPIYTAFNREAGSLIDTGDFGNATMNNTLVMTGAQGYRIDLANRFASETDTTVTFAFDSAALDGTAQLVLQRQAAWIRQFPEVTFRVYGHTDLVGSNAYNKSLGLKRAQTVVNYLVHQGIDRGRLEAVVSYGETQPLIVTQGRERRNRRTVTEVSGFIQNHPTVLDGKYAQIVYRDYVASAVAPTSVVGGGDN
ncbi:OmpA family protein [Mesobacterium pallidum]|uniref:OmpA family protein n=1 Tax=Mesobacterium pallidum TaxID=2872037 RepID=UPI001EE1E8F2|nr:OmpA family protein [Mesobacterium pallidum]